MAKKRNKIKPLATSSRQVDNTRGSMLWAYNNYRTNIMTSLLNDLIELENRGLDDNYCRIVRNSLDYFVNLSTEIPSGGFLTGNLYLEIQEFSRLYKDWNDINGTDETKVKKRRELLFKLRKQRQKITDKVRSLQFELSTHLDRKVLADTYKAIGDLITLVPDTFKSLAGAYSDYIKKGGFIA